MRAKLSRRVGQGDEVDAKLDFEFDAAAAPAGTTQFVTHEVRYRTWLVCKGRGAGRTIEVAPYDENSLTGRATTSAIPFPVLRLSSSEPSTTCRRPGRS
jgi:hypothetical protein